SDHAENLEEVLGEIDETAELDDLPTYEVGDDVLLSQTVERVNEVLDDAIQKARDAVDQRDDKLDAILERVEVIETMNTVLDKQASIRKSQDYEQTDSYQRAQKVITERARAEHQFARLAVAVDRARERYIDERLADANETVGRIFSKISGRDYYPDVSVNSDLEVIADGGEPDETIDVRSIFNQGDLNAAAVSLFLGLGAEVEPTHDFGAILLDDPIQSMDDEHVEGFAEALRGIAQKRQILLATHNPTLVDAVRDLDTRTRVFEFASYDVEMGPELIKTEE
ncbi:MAG: hypothetical protein ABEN55_23375, partial [Bradymonadaceae bacterium]